MTQLKLKKTIISLAIAVGSMQQAHAAWWASEWTQIANNIELVASYIEQVETAVSTYNSYKALAQQLKKLSEGDFQAALGDDAAKFKSAMKTVETLQKTRDAYTKTKENLEKQMAEGQAMLIKDPAQYYQLRKKLAEAKGGVEKANYEAELKTIDNAASSSEDLDKQIQAASAIDSTNSGLQNLAIGNAKMLAGIKELSAGIARSNAMAFEDKMEQKNREALAAQKQSENETKIQEGFKKYEEKPIQFTSPYKK
jgi:hypothetical protein